MHTNSTAMALNMQTIREGCSLIDGVSMRSPASFAPIQTDPPNIFTDLSGGIFVVGSAKLCLHDENLCLAEICQAMLRFVFSEEGETANGWSRRSISA